MSVPIIVVYHCVFQIGDRVLDAAEPIIREQMLQLKVSGLEDAASEIYIGVNGGKESERFSSMFPKKSQITYHGLKCRTENRTLLMMEALCRSRKEAYVLYFHSKGISHKLDSPYAINMSTPWRSRMMKTCVNQWRMCVKHLETYDACGSHWLTGQGWDRSQHFFAGTFYWTRASFFRTIPSLMTRQRIKDSGLDSPESRFEAEIVIGNGPRLPKVKNYYSGSIGT